MKQRFMDKYQMDNLELELSGTKVFTDGKHVFIYNKYPEQEEQSEFNVLKLDF